MSERFSCFVMMPYSEASDDLYRKAILPALDSLPILALRADKMGQREITVKAHVESAVRSADLCIADITGNNPNVIYELGYAYAKGKPVIVIQEAKDRKRTPINLFNIVILNYNRSELDSFSARLVQEIGRVISSISHKPDDHSKSTSFQRLDPHIIESLAKSLRRRFSALVYSPGVLVRQLAPLIRAAGAAKNLDIKIICSDPEGEFSRLRSGDIGVPVSAYRAELWEHLWRMADMLRGVSGFPPIKLTNRPVGNAVYIFDDTMLIVPYLSLERFKEPTGIVIDRDQDPDVFSLFEQEFARIWSEGLPIDFKSSRGRFNANQSAED